MLTAKIKRVTKGGGLAAIAKRLPQAVQKGVLNAAEDTKKIAVTLAPGPVRGAIKVEIVQNFDGDVLAARVFNDTRLVPWSSYAEFGTGLYVEDEGVKEAIRLKRAKSIPWYVHVSMVPASFARYGYPLVVGANGEKYWEVDGMRPHPYMYPAGHQNKDRNVDTVAEAVSEMIREVSQ